MNFIGLDTEFLPNDLTPTGLISIGLAWVDDDNKKHTYYAVNSAFDLKGILASSSSQWMLENVLCHLPSPRVSSSKAAPFKILDHSHPDVKDYGTIRQEVAAFLLLAASSVPSTGLCEEPSREDLQLVVNCGAQDVVRLHTLICGNDWSQMPLWVPYAADDVYRVKRKAYRMGLRKEDLPQQDPAKAHHALWDAEYELGVYHHILSKFGDI